MPNKEQAGGIYLYLTCTSHGKPIWRIHESPDCREANLPDRGVGNAPPVKRLGPFLVKGEEGVRNVLMFDPDININLEDASTWFEDPHWIQTYLATSNEG